MPLQAWLNIPFELIVQHVVQEDIRKHRTDNPALWRAGCRVRNAPVFQYARVEPFADQSKQYPIFAPDA